MAAEDVDMFSDGSGGAGRPDPWRKVPFGEMVFVGLDCEMSSGDLDAGGHLIQVGVAVVSGKELADLDVFSSLVGGHVALTSMAWSEDAARVHGISREDLVSAPSARQVDLTLRSWLLDRGAEAGRAVLVPVGFNVAAADMPFVRRFLPRSSELMSSRSVDLNAALYTLSSAVPALTGADGGMLDADGLKERLKGEADARLVAAGMPARHHDAAFDAAQALVGWHWLRRTLAVAEG